MRPSRLAFVLAAGIAMLGSIGLAQQAPSEGTYKILKKVKVGGDGGFDYIFADVEARRLYTPRNGAMGHLDVFNLDTLEPVGDIPTFSPAALWSIRNPIMDSPPPNRSRCGTPRR